MLFLASAMYSTRMRSSVPMRAAKLESPYVPSASKFSQVTGSFVM